MMSLLRWPDGIGSSKSELALRCVLSLAMNEPPSASHWPHSCQAWEPNGSLDVYERIKLCENIVSVLTFLSHHWHAGKDRNWPATTLALVTQSWPKLCVHLRVCVHFRTCTKVLVRSGCGGASFRSLADGGQQDGRARTARRDRPGSTAASPPPP